MQKVIIFGAGGTGRQIAKKCQRKKNFYETGGGFSKSEILFFVDNDEKKLKQKIQVKCTHKTFELEIKPVNEFAKKHKIFFVPIGDDISVAIQKI